MKVRHDFSNPGGDINKRPSLGVPRPTDIGLSRPSKVGTQLLADHDALDMTLDSRASISRYRPIAGDPLSDSGR